MSLSSNARNTDWCNTVPVKPVLMHLTLLVVQQPQPVGQTAQQVICSKTTCIQQPHSHLICLQNMGTCSSNFTCLYTCTHPRTYTPKRILSLFSLHLWYIHILSLSHDFYPITHAPMHAPTHPNTHSLSPLSLYLWHTHIFSLAFYPIIDPLHLSPTPFLPSILPPPHEHFDSMKPAHKLMYTTHRCCVFEMMVSLSKCSICWSMAACVASDTASQHCCIKGYSLGCWSLVRSCVWELKPHNKILIIMIILKGGGPE